MTTSNSFLNGLTALVLVLTVPLSVTLAFESTVSDAHECCQIVERASTDDGMF